MGDNWEEMRRRMEKGFSKLVEGGGGGDCVSRRQTEDLCWAANRTAMRRNKNGIERLMHPESS